MNDRTTRDLDDEVLRAIRFRLTQPLRLFAESHHFRTFRSLPVAPLPGGNGCVAVTEHDRSES